MFSFVMWRFYSCLPLETFQSLCVYLFIYFQWGLLTQLTDYICKCIQLYCLLMHICRCRDCVLSLWSGRGDNQLSVINRNTGRANLAVTTNKHLLGYLKASKGFLLHINTLDNTDAGTHTDTRWHSICLLPAIRLLGRLPSPLANYFDLRKQTPSLPLDFEISRLVCLLEKTKGAQSTQRFIKWHQRIGREKMELTRACKAYI